MKTALSVLFLCCTTARLGALCATTSLDQYFAGSRAVFVGRAIAREPSSRDDRKTVTTFEVEEMWKGSPDMTIRIETCGADRRDLGLVFSCEDSITFRLGSRYLVFAIGEPLQTDTCRPTGLIEGSRRSQDALRWLVDKPRIASR